MLVAVTGGIAEGKSTVLRWFEEWGAHCISLDRIAQELSAPQQPLWRAVVGEFGQGYLKPNGELDRKRLGEVVFADGDARRRVNRISHPLILAQMHLEIDNVRRMQPGALIAVEVPLLIECALYAHFHRVVVVEAGELVQQIRLLQQGFSSDEIRQRLSAQFTTRVKRIFADWVVWNHENIEQTRKQTWQVWKELRQEHAK